MERKSRNKGYGNISESASSFEYSKIKLMHNGKVQADHELGYERPKSSLNLPSSRDKVQLKSRKSASVIESSPIEYRPPAVEVRENNTRNWISISHNNSVISLNSGTDNLDVSSNDNSVNGKRRRRIKSSISHPKLLKSQSKCLKVQTSLI